MNLISLAAGFTDSESLPVNEARELLTHEKELNEITVRQLKQLLLNAAEGPMTNPELVARRVAAETKQKRDDWDEARIREGGGRP